MRGEPPEDLYSFLRIIIEHLGRFGHADDKGMVFRKLHCKKACGPYIHGILEGKLGKNLDALYEKFLATSSLSLGYAAIRILQGSGPPRKRHEHWIRTIQPNLALQAAAGEHV